MTLNWLYVPKLKKDWKVSNMKVLVCIGGIDTSGEVIKQNSKTTWVKLENDDVVKLHNIKHNIRIQEGK